MKLTRGLTELLNMKVTIEQMFAGTKEIVQKFQIKTRGIGNIKKNQENSKNAKKIENIRCPEDVICYFWCE